MMIGKKRFFPSKGEKVLCMNGTEPELKVGKFKTFGFNSHTLASVSNYLVDVVRNH